MIKKTKVYTAWCPQSKHGFMQIGDIKRYKWEVEYDLRALKVYDYKPVKVYITEVEPRQKS